ncbi:MULTISPECIES: serine/threonine-protein kinase [Streptomyces]|uniref:serine/threonine-protein kinase n=1 Tax=Streptomyces TaxID=1883 RepID=UPI001CCFF31D|nr:MULTISPECIES: serine/threonine protein kinase [Streptomyces]MBZ6173941.1 protein kinase [Streptomyces olivaceus]MBZ6180118.1 protein kinase [Streptomyces olivaceus]MCM8552574.1 protein kinase [Streptomyces sp. STCH 565 A]
MQGLGDGEPRQVGVYRLLGRLGAGGMGDVYLARSDRGRTVAVKLVREELAAQEEFRQRFRYEVKAARRVGGHWTAPVLDADTEAVVPWVATGYVAGPSLRQVVGSDYGPLPEHSVRTLAAGLALALRDIHGAGLVHRDLKPSNVLVTIDGPRVIDFGIARALETVTDSRVTRTGVLVGSPGFMAPEQVRGDRITPACDVFCLGSVLAYAATGKMPFGTAQTGFHVVMYRIAHEEPDLEGVPTALADVIQDCLEKDPAARPSLGEVLRRTGMQERGAAAGSNEPWLPGPLVAQLGLHAVSLLNTENPEPPASAPSRDDPPGREPAPETASVAQALPIPDVSPAPMPLPRLSLLSPEREPQSAGPAVGAVPTRQPASHSGNQNPLPQPSPSRKRGRGRMTMLIVAVVVALSAGSVIYTVTRRTDDHRADDAPSNTSTSSAGPSSGPSARDGVIPNAFLGAWTSTTHNKDDGFYFQRMTIRQGEASDNVVELVVDVNKTEGGTYHCELKARLQGVSESDDSVTFGPFYPSDREQGDECPAGWNSKFTLLSKTALSEVSGIGNEAIETGKGNSRTWKEVQ